MEAFLKLTAYTRADSSSFGVYGGEGIDSTFSVDSYTRPESFLRILFDSRHH